MPAPERISYLEICKRESISRLCRRKSEIVISPQYENNKNHIPVDLLLHNRLVFVNFDITSRRKIFHIECSVFQKHFLSLSCYRTGGGHIYDVKVFRVYSYIEI